MLLKCPIFIQGMVFIIYAYYYRVKCYARALLHGNRFIDEYMQGDKAAPKTLDKSLLYHFPTERDITSLINDLIKNGASVYGENIIQGYCKGKNILLISHEMSMSGAPIVLLHMAEILKSNGYQVLLIAPSFDNKYVELALKKSIPVVYYQKLFESDMIYKSRRIFYKVVLNTILCFPLVLLLQNTNTQVIWWIHECGEIFHKYQAKFFPRKLSSNIHIYCVGKYAEKMLKFRFPLYRTKRLLYYSPDLKIIGENDYNNTVNKIINGYDRNKKIYAVIGRIVPRKGQDILLEAVNMLPEDIKKQTKFLFIGKTRKQIDRESSRLDVREYEIGKRVIEASKKNPDTIIWNDELCIDQIYDIYKNIDFLICSSVDDPMPVVVAEAMSMGIPCICSENTGMAAIVRHFGSGLIYTGNNPKKLAEKIKEAYYFDKSEMNRLSINSRKAYVKIFSEKVFRRKIRQILDR